MPYGTYSGPDKPNKGLEGGACNRTLCQHEPALWYNHGSLAWYCESCKNYLYDPWAKVIWLKDFKDLTYPMFETRDMMRKRGVNDASTT